MGCHLGDAYACVHDCCRRQAAGGRRAHGCRHGAYVIHVGSHHLQDCSCQFHFGVGSFDERHVADVGADAAGVSAAAAVSGAVAGY